MDKLVNAGTMYIRNLLHLDVLTINEKETDELSLPSPYAQDWENQLVHEVLLTFGNNEICFLNDSFLSYYCLIHLNQEIVMIGPYREHSMTYAEARKRFSEEHFDDQVIERYVKWYNSQPLCETDIVKLAAHTLIATVYGTTKNTKEKTVNIQQYAKDYRLIPDSPPQYLSSADSLLFNELCFQYMEHIREGNYEEAVATYNRTMQYTKPHKKFAILDIVEGTSNIRTMTRLATQQVGVPITATQAILEDFKEKARMTTSKNEAVKLARKMISDICTLVRQYKTVSYSMSVALSVDYIHRNLAKPLSVSDIAREVGLSSGRLSVRFHEEVGVPIVQYIFQNRMEEAANLLMYTNLSIQDICTQVGILDSNYFSRRFKKFYGVSPGRYRKQYIETIRE